jgi:hypothetical protein
MSKLLKISLLFFIASCALSGRSNDNGVIKYITGAAKIEKVKNVNVVNIFRAIGSPDSSNVVGRYKYYRWDYSKLVGLNTLLGGGSTTFYCKLSAETQNEKIKSLSWYGNQCDIFLDQINDYFKNTLNIEIISEEDNKHKTTAAKAEIKPEIKVENTKNEEVKIADLPVKNFDEPGHVSSVVESSELKQSKDQ